MVDDRRRTDLRALAGTPRRAHRSAGHAARGRARIPSPRSRSAAGGHSSWPRSRWRWCCSRGPGCWCGVRSWSAGSRPGSIQPISSSPASACRSPAIHRTISSPPRFTEIVAQVRSIPGVASAAMISRMPIGSGGADCAVRADGAPAAPGSMHDAEFRAGDARVLRHDANPAASRPRLHRRRCRGRTASRDHQRNAGPHAVRHRRSDRSAPGALRGSIRGVRTVVGVIADVHANGLEQEAAGRDLLPADAADRSIP